TAFLVFQSSVGPLPVQQLTDGAGHFCDRQTGIIPRDLFDQLEFLLTQHAPTEAERDRNTPQLRLRERSATIECHAGIADGALPTTPGSAYKATDLRGTAPSDRDGERDSGDGTLSSIAAQEPSCGAPPVADTRVSIWFLSLLTSNSISTSSGFFPCWRALARMLLSTTCARAPLSVRFPPQFLRATTSGRKARSAALLVAS